MEALQEMLCEKCRLHDSEHFKEKALQTALLGDHGNCLQLLLEEGVDVNLRVKPGKRPLDIATGSGNVEMVRALLERGADVNLTDWDNYTPLMNAAHIGNAECVDTLLKAGADVNKSTDQFQFSALMAAARSGSVECTRLLIDAGADVNARHYYDRSALIQVINEEDPNAAIVELLLEAGACADDTDYQDGRTALNLAAFYGRRRMVQALIKAGADVNRMSEYNTSALTEASFFPKEGIHRANPSEHVRCLELLAEAGADVNMHDPSGATPLTKACRSGFDDGVNVLIKSGADVNKLSVVGDDQMWTHLAGHGLSPLMEAVSLGFLRCTELVVAAGADVNAKTTDGVTALMCVGSGNLMFELFEEDDNIVYTRKVVEKMNYLACTQFLFKLGATINWVDKYSLNALQRQLSIHRDATISKVAGAIDSTESAAICLLLYAAGEALGGANIDDKYFPECLRFDDLNLKHLCREAIRKQLISLDPHTHLFNRIPVLGLPSSLASYLLINVKI